MMPIQQRHWRAWAIVQTVREIEQMLDVTDLDIAKAQADALEALNAEVMDEIRSWVTDCTQLKNKHGTFVLVPLERIYLLIKE